MRKISRFCQTGCYEVDWCRRRIESNNGEKEDEMSIHKWQP